MLNDREPRFRAGFLHDLFVGSVYHLLLMLLETIDSIVKKEQAVAFRPERAEQSGIPARHLKA